MPVIYETDIANSGNQEIGNSTLASILTAINAATGGVTEAQELAVLQDILAAFAALATATNQTTAQATLTSILSALTGAATAANQVTAQTTLASILSALTGAATAANQVTANTTLAAINTKLTQPATATITNITQSPSSQTVLAANANRKGLYLYNDTGMKMYIAYSATASTSAFTFLLAANAGIEIDSANIYTGAISAIWSSGTSASKLQITEIA